MKDWDPYARIPWARAFLKKVSPGYRLASQILLDTIAGLVKEEVRWLDVGAGDNWLVHYYDEGSTGLGVGTDVYVPEELKRRDRFVVARGGELPFPGDFFDLVTCHWVVEHLERPDVFLGECFRVLRPGGRLFIRTTNLLSPLTVVARCLPERVKRGIVQRVFFSRKADFFRTHYRMNTPARMKRLPADAGFHVESIRYVEDLHFKNIAVFLPMFLFERLTALGPLKFFRSQVFAVYRKPEKE